jgi:hypothetical protein
MRKLISSFAIASGMFLLSCGDPSKDAGKNAAEQQNQNSTSGSTQMQDEGIKKDSVHSDDGKIKGSGSEPANSPPK